MDDNFKSIKKRTIILILIQNFKTYLTQNANISEKDFSEIISILQTKTIKKGAFLLQSGEICKYSFFVEKGLLRSYTIDKNGKEHIIQFAPESWIISDRSSTFFNESSELYIDAIEDSEVILLNDNFFEDLSCNSAEFAKSNTQALHNHIRNLQNRVNMLLGATAEDRYLQFVKMYPDILLRVPQWMIASYLGITPESLSRVRKELTKKNVKK